MKKLVIICSISLGVLILYVLSYGPMAMFNNAVDIKPNGIIGKSLIGVYLPCEYLLTKSDLYNRYVLYFYKINEHHQTTTIDYIE